MSYVITRRRHRVHSTRCRFAVGRPLAFEGRTPAGGWSAVAAFLRLVPCKVCRPEVEW